MRIIAYLHNKKEIRDKWLSVLLPVLIKEETIYLKTLKVIPSFHKQNLFNDALAVFSLETQRHLDRLLEVESLLKSIPLILILPNQKKNTIALAHRLLPRFLTFSDDDPGRVAAVLKKMIEKNDKRGGERHGRRQ
jgi:hypothetical protein